MIACAHTYTYTHREREEEKEEERDNLKYKKTFKIYCKIKMCMFKECNLVFQA